VRSALLLAMLSHPAVAGWQRLVETPKDSRVEKVSSHPLEYFTRTPLLSDGSGEFCYRCTPEKRDVEARTARARTEMHQVGRWHGLPVLDLYVIDQGKEEPYRKSVLVRRKANEYVEVYQVQPNLGAIQPSFLIAIGREELIGTRDDCQRFGCNEKYFWLAPDGPAALNFEPVFDAAQAACPKEVSAWHGFGDLRGRLPDSTIYVGTKDAWGHPSGTGTVEIRFKLVQGKFIVTGARFDPDDPYEW